LRDFRNPENSPPIRCDRAFDFRFSETAPSVGCFRGPLASAGHWVISRERRVEVCARVGRNWASEIKVGGETVRIHGHEIAVDALYA
jgi:hypothetical protein